MKPVIGITGRIQMSANEGIIGLEKAYVPTDYIDSVEAAGGIPLILPVIRATEDINILLQKIDGLIVSGGIDINPLLFGEEPEPEQGFMLEELDNFDIIITEAAYKLGIPILGICRGIQVINVVFGGSLYQDIKKVSSVKHDQMARRDAATHTVSIEKGSLLYDLYGETLTVNSYHHQAVKEPAPGFRITAKAKDGIIEAIEMPGSRFVLGVQWHPEMMSAKNENARKLFRMFVNKCSK